MKVYRNEAISILDETKVDYKSDSLHEGLAILRKYFPDNKFVYRFEHDEAWIGAAEFDEYAEVMTAEDVRRMGVLGWHEDEDSWHLTS